MIMGALGPRVVENQEPIKHNNGALATQMGVEILTAYPTMYEWVPKPHPETHEAKKKSP